MNKYLVFNNNTKAIFATFPAYCKQMDDLLRSDKYLTWINVTHPKTKGLLAEINEVNGTDYK